MDIAEVLRLADELMFASTSKYLNNLERSIVRGVYKNQKYAEISEESGYSEGHVNDVAANLWKIFSSVLGKKVKKNSFRASIERHQFSVNSSQDCCIQHLAFFSDINRTNQFLDLASQYENHQFRQIERMKTRLPPKELPSLLPFYGRSDELKLLKQWIVEEQCRSIVIYGTTGIGKTALARQIVQDIGDGFEVIIWQSLGCKRSVVEFIDRNLLPALTIDRLPEPPLDLEARLSLLIEYMTDRRCLIILDDLQDIFSGGELAGNYTDNDRNYQDLFRRIRELNHHSCVLQLSREQPIEIESLAADNRSIQTLKLAGLGETGKEIFRAKGLVDEERWTEVIECYGGNPKYLEIVARSISSSFGGKVSYICGLDRIFVTAQLKSILTAQFDRLSPLEQATITVFASHLEAIAITRLIKEMKISLADGCDAVESLVRRGLIERQKVDDEVLFSWRSIHTISIV